MTSWRFVGRAALAVTALCACEQVAPPPVYRISVSGPRQGGHAKVLFEGSGECPRPEEWGLVTWPEMELVSASFGVPHREYGSLCEMSIQAGEPLTERWYAAQWRGEPPVGWAASGAFELSDGTRAFAFRGVVPAVVMHVVTVPWMGRMFLIAEVSEQIDPGPGHDWGTLMRARQGEVECAYPGDEVTVVRGDTMSSIGFFETLVVECEGIDWAAPVHIRIEGAVARHGSRAPVPVVDVEHTFGVSTDSSILVLTDPFVDRPPLPLEH